jgi:hypothetical protein
LDSLLTKPLLPNGVGGVGASAQRVLLNPLWLAEALDIGMGDRYQRVRMTHERVTAKLDGASTELTDEEASLSTALRRVANRAAAVVGAAALIVPALALLSAAPQSAGAASTVAIHRIVGASTDNRYATEAAVSNLEFPTAHSAHNVIVTRGDIIPDGITASFMAKALGAPILLIGPPGSSVIPPETVAEVQRVLAAGNSATCVTLAPAPCGNIYVLGDANSVDSNTRAALATLVTAPGTVMNVDGTGINGNRFISSADHAAAVFGPSNMPKTFPSGAGPSAFFANGYSLIDALCAGQLAYLGFPVFLVANDGTLDPSVTNVIHVLGITQGVTLGDSNSIGPATAVAIQTATGHPVINESGSTRFGTCAALATLAISAPWNFGAATAMVMTLGFPRVNDPNPPSSLVDSIAAGTLGGLKGWPVTLADIATLPVETGDFMATHAAPVTDLYIPGSSASTPDGEIAFAQKVLQTGQTPGMLSSITATQNSSAITATFSKPVWSASSATPKAAGLTSDFTVAVTGVASGFAPTSVIVGGPTAGSASATVTLNIPLADIPRPGHAAVTVNFLGGGNATIVGPGDFVPDTSSASVTGTAISGATHVVSLTAPAATAGHGVVTLTFNNPVGLCAGAGTGTALLGQTAITNNVPPSMTQVANTPTSATSVTTPAQTANNLVGAHGSASTSIAFAVPNALPSGATVDLTIASGMGGWTTLCDLNSNPLTGTQSATTTAA